MSLSLSYKNEKYKLTVEKMGTSEKIIIFTIGTRCDLQPYIALAFELQKPCHKVTLANHPCISTLVEAVGYNGKQFQRGDEIFERSCF